MIQSIDSALQARINSNLQTVANKSNPSMQTIISRARTPIIDKRFWQETVVTAGATVSCTSVAIRRTGKKSDRVYVAYITGNVLVVKSAEIVPSITKMVWIPETTITGCIGCAIEFDCSYVQIGRTVEERTERLPTVFYVTSDGALMWGILGGPYEVIVSSGVTAIDAIRGISSLYKDIDQGELAFYVINGQVFYNQRIAGQWAGQQLVEGTPADVVTIKVERLFDYRICLQCTDATGALWEIFTKMAASGWNGHEYLTAGIATTLQVTEIRYQDLAVAEYIRVNTTAIIRPLYALSPVMRSVENIDNGAGNFGKIVKIKWNENVFGAVPGTFSVQDSIGGAWAGQSIIQTDRELTVTFVDFNNAVNPCKVVYTPGSMMGDVVSVDRCEIALDAQGLVPTELPKPICISEENTDNKTMILTFDMPVKSSDLSANAAAFTASAPEYDMIPGGIITPKTYEIESTQTYIRNTIEEFISLPTVLEGTQIDSNTIVLAEDK